MPPIYARPAQQPPGTCSTPQSTGRASTTCTPRTSSTRRAPSLGFRIRANTCAAARRQEAGEPALQGFARRKAARAGFRMRRQGQSPAGRPLQGFARRKAARAGFRHATARAEPGGPAPSGVCAPESRASGFPACDGKGRARRAGPFRGLRAGKPRERVSGMRRQVQWLQPLPQPPAWVPSGSSSPSSTWKEWPQPQDETAFGLSILNPDSVIVLRKSIVAPRRYGSDGGVDDDRHALELELVVALRRARVEPEPVLEARAAAALDRDPQHHRVAVRLLGHELLDLDRGRRRDGENRVGGALGDLHDRMVPDALAAATAAGHCDNEFRLNKPPPLPLRAADPRW